MMIGGFEKSNKYANNLVIDSQDVTSWRGFVRHNLSNAVPHFVSECVDQYRFEIFMSHVTC